MSEHRRPESYVPSSDHQRPRASQAIAGGQGPKWSPELTIILPQVPGFSWPILPCPSRHRTPHLPQGHASLWEPVLLGAVPENPPLLYVSPQQASKLLQDRNCPPMLLSSGSDTGKPSLPPHGRALCQDHCACGPSTWPGLSRECWTVLSTIEETRKEGSDRSTVTMLKETGGTAWPRNAWLQSPSHIPDTQLSRGLLWL